MRGKIVVFLLSLLLDLAISRVESRHRNAIVEKTMMRTYLMYAHHLRGHENVVPIYILPKVYGEFLRTGAEFCFACTRYNLYSPRVPVSLPSEVNLCPRGRSIISVEKEKEARPLPLFPPSLPTNSNYFKPLSEGRKLKLCPFFGGTLERFQHYVGATPQLHSLAMMRGGVGRTKGEEARLACLEAWLFVLFPAAGQRCHQ